MNTAVSTYDPRLVSRHLYDSAKWWNGLASILTFLGFIAGVTAILGFLPSKPIPFVVAAFAIAGVVVSHIARVRYASAEWLQRKLDMRDSFGWELSRRGWTDFLARCPCAVKRKARSGSSDEAFFASHEGMGAARAMQNVMESAWWSKHLSETMYKLYFILIGIALLGSLAALIVSVEISPITDQSGTPSRDSLSTIANVVTSVLMLVISLRLTDTALGFVQFSKEGDQCEREAEATLEVNSMEPAPAMKLWHEYQIGRATAPILPTWVWKWRRKELDALWKEHRQQ